MVGGHSEVKEPTDDIRAIVDGLASSILEKAGVTAESHTVVSFTSQVVAGTMFMVKIETGDQHVHAKIFKPLPHTNADPELKVINTHILNLASLF